VAPLALPYVCEAQEHSVVGGQPHGWSTGQLSGWKKLKSEVGASLKAEFYGLWMVLVNITIWYWYIIFWNLWFMDVYIGLW
jgi:hypothetical protein